MHENQLESAICRFPRQVKFIWPVKEKKNLKDVQDFKTFLICVNPFKVMCLKLFLKIIFETIYGGDILWYLKGRSLNVFLFRAGIKSNSFSTKY